MGRFFRLTDGYNEPSVIDLSNSKFLGQGRSGKVYLLPDGNVIKIFRDEEHCMQEGSILWAAMGSRHFPRIYECRGNYMIREYVGGICLNEYIKRYGLSPRLAVNLINLIEDFKDLGFTRLDMRSSHIFVQHDESIKVIDPRQHFTMKVPYPKMLLHNLRELHVLHKFMKILKEVNPMMYAKCR